MARAAVAGPKPLFIRIFLNFFSNLAESDRFDLYHETAAQEWAFGRGGRVVGNPHGLPAIHSSLKVDRHVAIPSVSFLIPPSAPYLSCITNCIFEGCLNGEMRCGFPFMMALRGFIADKAVF